MIKHNFCRSKILISIANTLTGDIQVITCGNYSPQSPLWYCGFYSSLIPRLSLPPTSYIVQIWREKVWSGLWCEGWGLSVKNLHLCWSNPGVLDKQYSIYVAFHLNTLPLHGQRLQNSSLGITPFCFLPVYWTSGTWVNLPGLPPPYNEWSKIWEQVYLQVH